MLSGAGNGPSQGRPRRQRRQQSPPAGPRGIVSLLPWALLGAAAIAIAIASGVSATVAACLAALGCSAAALGFLIGDRGRAALELEIEGRTSELKRALSELEIAQAETVRRLSMAVEFRDEDTGEHIERIGRFSMLLAEQIGMDPEFCERIRHAAPLHDVGKVAIPDAILLKPGPLTPEERAIVETHAEEGHRLVRGSSSAILDMAATIALSHQEKWDGSGYPRGLKGEAIPIEGRIVAVADVFDALTSDRVYRPAFPVEEAVQMMREERGRTSTRCCWTRSWKCSASTGPDARERCAPTRRRSSRSTLETFVTALERGDAERRRGGDRRRDRGRHHADDAARRGDRPGAAARQPCCRASGEIDAEREHRAADDHQARARHAQPLHDRRQPSRRASGCCSRASRGTPTRSGCRWSTTSSRRPASRRSSTPTSPPRACSRSSSSRHPDLVVVGGTGADERRGLGRDRAARPARPATPRSRSCSGAPPSAAACPRERDGMSVLERIDESVRRPVEDGCSRPSAHRASASV